MNKYDLAAIFGLLALLCLLVLAWHIFEWPTCAPVHGVDHNGKNEPFTVFLGIC